MDTETAASLPIVYFLHGWPGSPLSMIYSIVPALDKAFQGGADPFIAVFPDGNAKDDYTQPIHGEMVRWSTLLQKMKVSVETHAPTGGHSFAFVTGQIPTLVKWFDWSTT